MSEPDSPKGNLSPSKENTPTPTSSKSSNVNTIKKLPRNLLGIDYLLKPIQRPTNLWQKQRQTNMAELSHGNTVPVSSTPMVSPSANTEGLVEQHFIEAPVDMYKESPLVSG